LAPAKCNQKDYAEKSRKTRRQLRAAWHSGLSIVSEMLTVELDQVVRLADQTQRPLHNLFLFKQTTRDTTDKTHLSPACKGRFVCETHAARRVIVYEATARCVDSNMTAERKRIDDFNHVTILQGNEIHSGLPSTNSADVTTFHWRTKGEHCARMHEMDEGRKRVIGIMAAILAARKLAVRWREAYPCTRAAERPKAIVAILWPEQP
jgi:hypothetical protein